MNEASGEGSGLVRHGLLLAGGAWAFSGSIGAAATRFEGVARAWNKVKPLADHGLRLGRRK
jgi:hypothetical protein